VVKRFVALVVLALAAFVASNVLAVSVHPGVLAWTSTDGSTSYWYGIVDKAAITLSAIVLPWLALWPLAVQVQEAIGSPPIASRRFILAHLAVCTAFSLAQTTAHVWFEPGTWQLYHFDAPYRVVSGLMYYLGYNSVFYVGIVAMHQAIHSRQRLQQTALNEARLEASLTRARMDSLRMRIHPHFIFNTLQSINVLVLDRQTERASEMIEKLSVLLRQAIDGDDRQLVTVAQETESVQGYLEIEAIRFCDRLRLEWAVGPETSRALVPSLLLQPLIENAIKHGVAARTEVGTVTVSVRREDDELVLSVRNDGPPLPSRWQTAQQGFGLKATRQRLELLYGSSFSFEVRDVPTGGVETRIAVPFREEVFAAGSPARI